MKLLLVALILISCNQVLAWGGRGHDAICQAAVFLVKEPGLKEYLQHKPHKMSHLCNIPDFYWKSLGSEVNKLGNSTHFIDIEVIGLQMKDVPTDFKKIMADFTGKPNPYKKDGTTIKSIPQEFGSSWWRADQFMRSIAAMKSDFEKAALPANFKEEQNYDLPYNKLVFQMLTSMGLLGHFVGDNGQPFHTTADYDGYDRGHGGIHAFYEDSVVGMFDGDLDLLILKSARALKNPEFLKPATTIEKMRALSAVSYGEIDKILKQDLLIKKSTLIKDRGMEIKTPAERPPAEKAFPKMKNLIVMQMSRSALLLANLWDESYRSAGRPNLGAYKSYKYPFTVDFVAPDYFTEADASDIKK